MKRVLRLIAPLAARIAVLWVWDEWDDLFYSVVYGDVAWHVSGWLGVEW